MDRVSAFMLTSVKSTAAGRVVIASRLRVTGGVDGYASFAKKRGSSKDRSSDSEVTERAGDPLNETSSSRYYQRPDAENIHFDPTRTSLSGWGGRAMLSKATGFWRRMSRCRCFRRLRNENDTGFMPADGHHLHPRADAVRESESVGAVP